MERVNTPMIKKFHWVYLAERLGTVEEGSRETAGGQVGNRQDSSQGAGQAVKTQGPGHQPGQPEGNG